ncbi:hypothetical protein CBR_g37365 [Chara braunii]|uniref:HAT C-terminal dimerisation domain-containing protein n=1 Tax=Chara braunii TaxID=69332 RepID=A0A388JZP2_CHABU|nr:hypothetical protein CBR_g37365 [Chara braunii]|eukprot:GBG63279.1 hypothetical protein CBR_g37365 [Chara braunii]
MGGEDENRKAQKKCCVYKYIHVGQTLGERFCGNRMLKCVFCGHEFQGNQFVAVRHFRQGKGYPEVTDEALLDIHYNSEYKISDKFLERIQRFEELHGAAPAMDPRRDEGGEGEMRDAGEQIDVDNDVKEVARGGSSGRERGKGIVSEPGGQQGQYFASAHVSARTRAGADTAEAGASAGKRKEREEGDRPTATAAAQKRMRQNTITESFTSKWQMEFKKKWLRFVYSQRLAFNVFRSEPWLDVVRHFRDLPGPVKVLWPSENEIADIETIVHTADNVGADLAEVRAPFYVTGATIMSDGRKSRDARPIVNFLAGGSCGVMLVRTMNREVRSALERTMDGDTWGMVPWDHSVRQLARWVRWQVRHGSWWDSMGILFRIMEPVYGLLRRLDRGGLHMSRVVEWTQDLARRVAKEVCALLTDLAHYIVQRVQARCAHMLEPSHVAAHLLCPSRRDLRYFKGVVSDYDASLVREVETYILSKTGFSVASRDYETACAQLRDFHTRRGTIAWGGRDGDRDAQRCRGDAETYESGCWWSRYGQCAPQLQVIALRVMYMWTCSSPVERNWAIHEAATLHPYPRDDSDSEGHEDEGEPAGPASVTHAADERDEWSDPEDVRRRSGGDDLFVRVDLEEESGGRHGSPLERPRPTSAAPLPAERVTDPGSAPLRGAESGIAHRPLGRSGTASSTTLPTSTEQLHRQPVGADRLQRLVRGPRQLEDRLEGGPMPVQGDDGDKQGLVGGDGGALAGGGGGAEVDAAVEGIPMGGGGGFSEFGDMGMPPGESESRGDISVGMQALL